jgi:hypothetical protein
MRSEHLHAKLMLEAAQNEERQWYEERLEFAKAPQPESKSAQCMRKLRDLRAKTNAIEWELDLRQRVELEGQRHLKATNYGTARSQYDSGREAGESRGDEARADSSQ